MEIFNVKDKQGTNLLNMIKSIENFAFCYQFLATFGKKVIF
jgi:hypothetical protein